MKTDTDSTNHARTENKTVDVRALYKQYLKSKEHVWTTATLRSESYRLSRFIPALEETLNTREVRAGVERMWAQVKHLAPYTRSTTWTRIIKFIDWANKEHGLMKSNPFADFREANPQIFRNVYERKIPDISFEEISKRLDRIPNEADRERAKDLLRNGLRLSDTRIDHQRVKGKGGKVRRVYHRGVSNTTRSDSSLRRALKRLGTKPHDLRKIAACELARQGASAFALTKIFGWSNINTAQSYIAASDSECEDLMMKLRRS